MSCHKCIQLSRQGWNYHYTVNNRYYYIREVTTLSFGNLFCNICLNQFQSSVWLRSVKLILTVMTTMSMWVVRLASLIFFESLVSPPRLILRFSNRSRLFSASFIARNSMILNVTKETHGNMWTKIIRNLEMKTERVCIVRVPSFLAHVAKALKSLFFHLSHTFFPIYEITNSTIFFLILPYSTLFYHILPYSTIFYLVLPYFTHFQCLWT